MRGWIRSLKRRHSMEGIEPCCCSTFKRSPSHYMYVGWIVPMLLKAFLAKVPMNSSVDHYLVVYLVVYGAIFHPNAFYLVYLDVVKSTYNKYIVQWQRIDHR